MQSAPRQQIRCELCAGLSLRTDNMFWSNRSNLTAALTAGLLVFGSGLVAAGAQAPDIKQLAAALAAGAPADRQAAADALADQGYLAQEAVPQLVVALGSEDP